MNLTLEEQERRAYANGDVERAALLATTVDGSEELLDRITELEDCNADLRYELEHERA